MADPKRGTTGSEAQQTARGQNIGSNIDQPVSAAEIARSLKGIDFPAKREELVRHARQNSARDQVVSRLGEMAEKEYVSLADVEHEFHVVKTRK